MQMNPILESCRLVCSKSSHVSINAEAIEKAAIILAEAIQASKYDIKQWKHNALHPKTIDRMTVNWIFLIDLMNFSFWKKRSAKEPYTVTFDGHAYTGYWSLCACIQRALSEGVPITDPNFYATATNEQLRSVFRTDDDTYAQLI
jgi:Potential Queuosine, Q, salvage protein family